MRDKFITWLISYKTYGLKAANKTVSALDLMSDEMNVTGIIDKGLFSCVGFVDYAKCRREIQKVRQFEKGEVKVLELLGDFYQFTELTNIRIEVSEGRLEEYCKSMKMSYSYKPVLIMALVELGVSNKPCKICDVVDYCIKYYMDRNAAGKVVEKSGSVFSKLPIDIEDAKKTIINNPLSVLEKDGVVFYDKQNSLIRLSSAYSYDTNSEKTILSACKEKIKEYYDKMSVHSEEDSIEGLIRLLEKNLSEMLSNQQYKYCDELILKIKNRLGIDAVHTFLISKDDPRKIGILVKETMDELSKAGHIFSEEEISNFTSIEWSKQHLKLYYPFFLRVENAQNLSDIGKDHLGKKRYWNIPYSFNGTLFLITSQWYIESKEKYIDWFNSLR